jgi:hypothetical protein
MKNAKHFLGELEAPLPQPMLEEAEKRAKRFRFAPVEKIKKI